MPLINVNSNRYAREDLAIKRNSYRNSRFYRHRNMDRMKQERHTLERERVAERASSKRFVLQKFFIIILKKSEVFLISMSFQV